MSAVCINLHFGMFHAGVDWNDGKSQEGFAAVTNKSIPSWFRSIKLLLSLFSEILMGQRVRQ